jgi:hypothetical protein
MSKAFVFYEDKNYCFLLQYIDPNYGVRKIADKRQWKPDVRTLRTYMLAFLLFHVANNSTP